MLTNQQADGIINEYVLIVKISIRKGSYMKDEKVLAYCNMFAVLGAIPKLLELDENARKIVENKKISIGFSVKNGPSATLAVDRGTAKMREGTKGCSIKLYFPSCAKFNGMIDGTAMPVPVSGFHHLPFLLGGCVTKIRYDLALCGDRV